MIDIFYLMLIYFKYFLCIRLGVECFIWINNLFFFFYNSKWFIISSLVLYMGKLMFGEVKLVV